MAKRGVNETISYCYDSLHRMTGKAYSAQTCQNGQLPAGTAVVSFTYDQGTNGVGRMTGLTDQAGTGSYTYDSMGRISSETRVISGVSKSMSYDYNLDGSVKALHYPSGRIVNYTYNAAARPITAIDANGTQYVTNATHWPSGAEYQRWMPNIYFSTTLNNRLQISGLYSDNGQTAGYYMNKTYSYGTQNNGNVMSIANNKDPNRTATYTYDALNRISSGWTTANTGALSWGENYTIDGWGNLMISPMGGKAHGGNFQCAGDNSNRATCLSYDSAGNVTANGSAAYSYDQENRLSSTAGTNYVYDAEGNRVKKSSDSSGTLYWYGSPGIVAETDLTGTLKSEYVFFGGKRIARIDLPGNTIHYYLSDHLNSTSMVVSASGVSEEESDYSPFGTEYQVSSTGANHFKFTSKERDTETQLDYFGARYYSNALGRFITPDWAAKATAVLYADFAEPQSLNLYTYVRNVPTTRYDADGHCSSPAVGAGQVGICIDYYISTKTVDPKGLGKLGLGDNRNTTASDNQGRFRVEIKLVVTRGDTGTTISGTSQAGMSKTAVGLQAPGKETTSMTASQDKSGNIHLDVNTTGINGFQAKGLPGPPGAIQGDVKIVITPDNKVGTDAGGGREQHIRR